MRCAARKIGPQCPRCESLNVGPWGAYHAQPGLKRYRCKERAASAPSMTSRYAIGWQQALGDALDSGYLSLVPVVFIAAYCPRVGRVLSARVTAGAGGCAMRPCPMRSGGSWRDGRSRRRLSSHRRTQGTGQDGRDKRWALPAGGRRKKREPGRGHYDGIGPPLSPG